MKRLFLLVGLLTATAHAEPLNYNVISLDAEARREMANDLMRASLFAEMNDADAAKLANNINNKMHEAKKLAGAYPGIRFSAGDNQTYPVYDQKNRMTGWRSRAEVRLECRDFRQCSELIGKLQSVLQLGSWEFTIADETRQRVESELTSEAIAAFRGKAEVVARAFKSKNYRIVNMALNSRMPYAPRMAYAKAGVMAAAEAAPPMADGGTGSVMVTVNGSIQVQE
jgi:predicted secreted protein